MYGGTVTLDPMLNVQRQGPIGENDCAALLPVTQRLRNWQCAQ